MKGGATVELIIERNTLIYQFGQDEFKHILSNMGFDDDKLHDAQHTQEFVSKMRAMCREWTMAQPGYRDNPVVKEMFKDEGMIAMAGLKLSNGIQQIVFSKASPEAFQQFMHNVKSQMQAQQQTPAPQPVQNSVPVQPNVHDIMQSYLQQFMNMLAEEGIEVENVEVDDSCVIEDEDNPDDVLARDFDDAPAEIEDIENGPSCFACLRDKKIDAFLAHLREKNPDIPLAEVQANVLKTICYRNAMDEVGLQRSTEYTDKILALIEKAYYAEPKIKYFYRLRTLHDGLDMAHFVHNGAIIKKQGVYYMMSWRNDPILLEYGAFSPQIFYGDNDVICKIENGAFVKKS